MARLLVNLGLFLVLCAVSAHAQCAFSAGGHTYDFSALTESGSSYYTVQDSQGYQYDLNICGTVGNGDSKCVGSKQGMICQYQNSAIEAVVAQWTQGAAQWSLVDASDPSKGVQMSLSNGDSCNPVDPNPRTSQIKFVCDPSVKGTLQASSEVCNYAFVFPTKYACVGTPPGPPSNPTGGKSLSGGWIFVIIILVSFPLYIAAGCGWNFHRRGKGERLMDNFPNIEFWRSVPGLVRDGFWFSVGKVRGLMGGRGGAGAESYETME